jgi:hypothetical protein
MSHSLETPGANRLRKGDKVRGERGSATTEKTVG